MRISDWSSDVCSSDLAGPARAKQNGHFARRRGDRAQVDACLRNGFVNSAAPAFGLEQVVIEIAAAHTEHTAFASAVLFQDDRDVEAHQRADVACGKAVGANDVDDAPATGEAYRALRHTRIARACRSEEHTRLNYSH